MGLTKKEERSSSLLPVCRRTDYSDDSLGWQVERGSESANQRTPAPPSRSLPDPVPGIRDEVGSGQVRVSKRGIVALRET
jgi:hypothetical protein